LNTEVSENKGKDQGIRYEGPKMDTYLVRVSRTISALLMTTCRTVTLSRAPWAEKSPYGDWLVFDEGGKHLIDVMPDDLFEKTYETMREAS
jgi:hypothetical protein